MFAIKDIVTKKPWLAWVLFAGTLAVGIGVGLLLTSIATRKVEGQFAYTKNNHLSEYEPRNELWGKSFPQEFETYYKTQDTSFASKYNGNKPIDMLAVDPRLVVLWAGYAFSKQYNQSRGHYYAVEDVRNILRTGAPNDTNPGPMPGTCWTCKSPDVPRMMSEMGVDSFYKTPWSKLGHEIINPIGCADCHDPKTMALRITRPALVNAWASMGKDVTKASHQEMKSLVCAQCHVEYYFKGKDKELVFPWKNGYTVENMEAYYDSVKFTDWTHALSKAPMLKAQHTDYEVFQMGIHAQRGLSCADCHMPYRTEGGKKFTDHHIQSPLNNIANSCQVCHRESAEELRKNVYERQDKIIASRDRLEEIIVRAHVEAKAAWDNGVDSVTMAPTLQLIRKAQWRWDYAAAGHGNAFHAPVEIGRIIADGTAIAQDARVQLARILAKLGVGEIAYPDIADKAKAQKFIGLDMDKLNAEKQVFITNVVPKWLAKGKEREAKY